MTKIDRSIPLPIHRKRCKFEKKGECGCIGGRCTIETCNIWEPEEDKCETS